MQQRGAEHLADRRPDPARDAEPASAEPRDREQVFAGFDKAGLPITANTATLGPDGGDIVTKIYATYLGWPLDVTEFRSATALSKAVAWADGEEPGNGEPPIALAGVNILITWGPARSGAHAGEAECPADRRPVQPRVGSRRPAVTAADPDQRAGQGRGDRITERRGVPESRDVAQACDVTQTGDAKPTKAPAN